MIAFAKPLSCDFSGAQCTVAPQPGPCLECEPSPVPDGFTITFAGLPEDFTCDVCEAERIKRELLGRMGMLQ